MLDFWFPLVLGLPFLTLALGYFVPMYAWVVCDKVALMKDYDWTPVVSVMLPCFNEGQHVYETVQSLRSCRYPQDKLQIVAIDDCSSDDSYTWIKKAAADFGGVTVLHNARNAGKTKSVMRASHEAVGEILITVDSDTIFHPDAIRELVACFADPEVAAVGGRVGISNTNETLITRTQTFFYYMCFYFPKAAENLVRSVSCVSGCLSSFRRAPYFAIEEGLAARNFMGIGVDDGDDRYITQSLLYHGYKTVVNNDAQCWTKSPTTVGQLFNQQLRWRRSAIRSWQLDLQWTFSGKNTLHPIGVVFMFLPLVALSVMLTLTLAMFATQNFAELILFLSYQMCFMSLVGVLFNLRIKKRNPEQVINDPIAFLALPVYLFVDYFLITILALCTLDFGGWGTRETAVKKGAESL